MENGVSTGETGVGGPLCSWNLPLSRPPIPAQIGIAVHGRIQGPSEERYRLPDLWCLHLYRYEGELEIAGTSLPIRPGHASVVPADVPMVFRYGGPSVHCYCHFRPDFLAAGAPDAVREIPAMQDLGRRFAELNERLSSAALSPAMPAPRRQAIVWEILWALADPEPLAVKRDSAATHPAVDRALREIERRLAEPLSVATLAEESGVSYGYLSRLFQTAVGDSVIGYIQGRRAERAEHLLRFSTLPIKSIAISVGIPDLQRFNRAIHRAFGRSPRQIRASHGVLEP